MYLRTYFSFQQATYPSCDRTEENLFLGKGRSCLSHYRKTKFGEEKLAPDRLAHIVGGRSSSIERKLKSCSGMQSIASS